MMTVMLYGHLGRHFGRRHRYAVRSPAEAVRALCATLPGFRRYVSAEHSTPGYRVLVGKAARDAAHLHNPAEHDVIRLVPVVAGAGGGWGQVIFGIALVALSFATGGVALVGGSLLQTSLLGGMAFKFGTAMILGGISQLLSPQQKGGNNNGENSASDVFAGAVNTSAQGNPVPLGYGRLLIGSQVVSAGLYVDEIAPPDNAAPDGDTGSGTPSPPPGGWQYRVQ